MTSYISEWGFLIILTMAFITIGLRMSGFVLAKHLPKTPITNSVIEAIPAIVLISLISPNIINAGWHGWISTIVAMLFAWKPGGLLAAMLGGTITMALLRYGFEGNI